MNLKLSRTRTAKRLETRPINVEHLATPRAQVSSSVTIEVLNYSNTVVHTRDHNGIVLTHQPLNVRPKHPDFSNQFVIAIKRYINPTTVISRCDLDNNSDIGGVEWIDEMLGNMRSDSKQIKDTVNCQCILIDNKLLSSGESIYVREVDMLVMGKHHDSTVVHPNSPRALSVAMNEIYELTNTFSISINDKSENKVPFYINIGGKVMTIYPGSYPGQTTDVRIAYKRPDKDLEIIYEGDLNIDKLRELGVFRNYEEAFKYSDRHKLRLTEMEAENLRLGKELERVKLESSLTNNNASSNTKQVELELKLEELRAKQQAEMLKFQMEKEKMYADLESERRKTAHLEERRRMEDYYERRSYERKDSNEMFKLAPLLLGGGLGLLAILGK